MLIPQLPAGLLKTNPTQIRTPGFEIMYIPKLVTDAVATAHAEGATATVSDPVLGRTTLGAQRIFSISPSYVELAPPMGGVVATVIQRNPFPTLTAGSPGSAGRQAQ